MENKEELKEKLYSRLTYLKDDADHLKLRLKTLNNNLANLYSINNDRIKTMAALDEIKKEISKTNKFIHELDTKEIADQRGQHEYF